MKNTYSVVILTLGLAGLFSVGAYSADETCVTPSSEKSSAKRRRSTKNVIECVDSGDSTNEKSPVSSQKEIRTKRVNISKEPRKKNPVSLVPRVSLSDYRESVLVPDRWRIVEALGYEGRWYDPYNRNVAKGDRPVFGEDWFFNLGVISDTVYEPRDMPTPVGSSSTNDAGNIGIFGDTNQTFYSQSIIPEFVLYKGDTVFRPPDYEFRFTPVLNINRLELEEIQGVNVDPRNGRVRDDHHLGIQAAFVDVHLRNVSERYDFDSVRVGIQPFSTDFRGFLFQDSQLGIRLFGNRDNNIYQYNLGLFGRLEKDTNSGLNDVGQDLRKDYIFFANIYKQDFPTKGFVSQLSFTYNVNREDSEFYFDNNEFISRPASLGREVPRAYDVGYFGYSGDGHFGRINLSTSLYLALGKSKPDVFTSQNSDIEAQFLAMEFSVDYDWIRPRLSLLYSSGDDNPFDSKSKGFDAIFENPQFAGADTSYWIRQNVPLIGGGRVTISPRNGVINSLRSSKEQGQSNFTNPGTQLVGVGVDMDILPELRLTLNANQIYFDDTTTLEVARNQGHIDKNIGLDVSASIIYRPLMSQNVVLRASYAQLMPGQGFDDLFPDENAKSILINLVLSY